MAPTVYTSEEVEKPKTATGAAIKACDFPRVRRLRMKSTDKLSKVEKCALFKRPNDAISIAKRLEGGTPGAPLQLSNCDMDHLKAWKNALSSRVSEKGDLLDITLRTLHLVERNRILQKQLAQLKLETQDFISAVMANPENKKQLAENTL